MSRCLGSGHRRAEHLGAFLLHTVSLNKTGPPESTLPAGNTAVRGRVQGLHVEPEDKVRTGDPCGAAAPGSAGVREGRVCSVCAKTQGMLSEQVQCERVWVLRAGCLCPRACVHELNRKPQHHSIWRQIFVGSWVWMR